MRSTRVRSRVQKCTDLSLLRPYLDIKYFWFTFLGVPGRQYTTKSELLDHFGVAFDVFGPQFLVGRQDLTFDVHQLPNIAVDIPSSVVSRSSLFLPRQDVDDKLIIAIIPAVLFG